MDLVLRLAGDPKVENYAQGVRVGPGTRTPRLPALYRPKRRWRLPEQTDPRLVRVSGGGTIQRSPRWKNRCWKSYMMKPRGGRSSYCRNWKPRKRYPSLVIASLGTNRKEKPCGQIKARVLFDGTNGLEVNKRTRVLDQERAPIAADLKRSVRAKAARGETTSAQIHPQDWRLLGCQVRPGGDVFINTVGTFGVASASCHWSWISAALGRLTQ